MFVPDKPLQAVLLGEPIDLALAMLPGAPNEVAGDTIYSVPCFLLLTM